MEKYLRLLRPKHGVKNLLALLPVFLSGESFSWGGLGYGLLAAMLFWIAASGVYAANDLLDAPRDRLHPVKRFRPVASGEIPAWAAAGLAFGLWTVAIVASLFLFSWWAALLVMIYIVVNLAYSLGLKDVPVVETAALAVGFLIRVAYGGLAVGYAMPSWLMLCVAGASFHLVFDKRRNEVCKAGGDIRATRRVLSVYDEAFLSRSIGLCRSLSVMCYAAWAVSSGEGGTFAAYLPITVPLLLVTSFLYDLSMGRVSEDRDMVSTVLGDRPLVISAVLYLAAVGIVLYV